MCAGSHDTFEVYVWSMQTGRLLEVRSHDSPPWSCDCHVILQLLAGHEAPVSSLSFCPSRALLVSGSWDKTVRIWDVFESKGASEILQISADGRPACTSDACDVLYIEAYSYFEVLFSFPSFILMHVVKLCMQMLGQEAKIL